MVTDLSNKIPLCDDWDPDDLKSPAQPITPTSIDLPQSKPIAPARPMAVDVPTTVTRWTDSFINDLIWVFLDTPKKRRKELHPVPLAIHATTGGPHMGADELVRWRGLLSNPKLIAKGTQAEV
jgi:hypothetical protein